jgi:hypothetical protein
MVKFLLHKPGGAVRFVRQFHSCLKSPQKRNTTSHPLLYCATTPFSAPILPFLKNPASNLLWLLLMLNLTL